jgi:hypothetical protein
VKKDIGAKILGSSAFQSMRYDLRPNPQNKRFKSRICEISGIVGKSDADTPSKDGNGRTKAKPIQTS